MLPPLSPEGPYSLVSTIYFIRLHARSYVTPLILRATKPGADDLENPWQRVFFLFVSVSEYFGTFVGSFFPVCGIFFFRHYLHREPSPLSTHRRHEMLLGFVIGTVVALYLQFSPAQSLPLASINSTMEVLVFEKVWGRSFCRTIEKLVEVVQEYPSEVEHIYSPSCVPLVRCAGCCGDENLECHPTQTTNVTMQLLKIRPSEQGQEYVEMTFVEHQTCE